MAHPLVELVRKLDAQRRRRAEAARLRTALQDPHLADDLGLPRKRQPSNMERTPW